MARIEELTTGTWVWVRRSGHEGVDCDLAAQVKSASDEGLVVYTFTGTTLTVARTDVALMHATSAEGLDDMIALYDLHEGSLIHNLQLRFAEDSIYTYTGSILVSMNPYQSVPIYTPAIVEEYRGARLGELPPHVFAIADAAYRNVRATQRMQSILISGESGAGKSEATKLILSYLATVSGQRSWVRVAERGARG